MNKINNDVLNFKRKPKEMKEEFNERLLYELYKEYPFDNSREIRWFMLKHHGVRVSTNLVTDISNYQIRKYGQRKSNGKGVIKFYKLNHKNSNRRIKDYKRKDIYNKSKKIIDRNSCTQKLSRRLS